MFVSTIKYFNEFSSRIVLFTRIINIRVEVRYFTISYRVRLFLLVIVLKTYPKGYFLLISQ